MPGLTSLRSSGPRPHLLEDPGPEVLNHHVGGAHQVEEELPTFRLGEIDGHRALVAALAEPDKRVTTFGVGSEAAEVVARAGTLDLDDVGAELPQHGGTVGTGNVRAEVENANSF